MAVLPFDDALGVVLREARGAAARVREVEGAPLLESAGRVLAERVTADRDQPPFDRSTRDGYAVRAADVGGALRLVGTLKAGEAWGGAALGAGEAVEIMTGAPMPEGADAVLMVEHVAVEGGNVRAAEGRGLKAGANVVPRGAEARAGAGVLAAGTVVGAAEIAVAASCGRTELPVFARPTVAIVATGDELVELDVVPRDSEIRNSNSYALAALIGREGGGAKRLEVARDTRDSVRERIREGMGSDLLVLSGGVSMGKFDLVEEVLAEFRAEFFFTGALIQPGKPVVFGRLPKGDGEWMYFFGLPGNPVSTQVTFSLFVAPMVRALAGRAAVAPVFVEARLGEDTAGGARVTRFLPAEMRGQWDGVTVSAVGWQGSGDVAANARGNCYVVLPGGVERFAKDEAVRVLLR